MEGGGGSRLEGGSGIRLDRGMSGGGRWVTS